MLSKLPTLAVGTVTIVWRDGFERKSKTGLFIGTDESINDPRANIRELVATCEKFSIPLEDVISITLEGELIPPPEELQEAFDELNLGAPICDGLEIVRH